MYKSPGLPSLRYKKKKTLSVSTFVVRAQNVMYMRDILYREKIWPAFLFIGPIFFFVCVNLFGYFFRVENVVPVIAQIFSSA